MFKNYFLTALRVLTGNRSYSAINIKGLSVGISSALIIFSILHIHTSFDQFHTKKDRIYRVVTDSDDNGKINPTHDTPIIQQGLQGFECRVLIGAGVFILTVGVSLIIATISVGYQVLRAALANPVHALKYE